MKEELLKFIGENPQQYMDTQQKTLEKRLEKLNSNEKDMRIKKGIKQDEMMRKSTLNLFGGLGGFINTIIDWNAETNKELQEAKKSILLSNYLNKTDSIEQSMTELREFISNPYGNTIFNKILSMLEDSPPDQDLLNHLTKVLTYIIDQKNFEKMFSNHKFFLTQLDKLSPQALVIIADYKEWPPFNLQMSQQFGELISSDFHKEFTNAYTKKKKITDINKIKRIEHTIIEIKQAGIVIGIQKTTEQRSEPAKMVLTTIGSDLLPYLDI